MQQINIHKRFVPKGLANKLFESERSRKSNYHYLYIYEADCIYDLLTKKAAINTRTLNPQPEINNNINMLDNLNNLINKKFMRSGCVHKGEILKVKEPWVMGGDGSFIFTDSDVFPKSGHMNPPHTMPKEMSRLTVKVEDSRIICKNNVFFNKATLVVV